VTKDGSHRSMVPQETFLRVPPACSQVPALQPLRVNKPCIEKQKAGQTGFWRDNKGLRWAQVISLCRPVGFGWRVGVVVRRVIVLFWRAGGACSPRVPSRLSPLRRMCLASGSVRVSFRQ
jgi:hypothetical protein